MFKIYKKTIHFENINGIPHLKADDALQQQTGFRLTKLITVPAMIIGSLVSVVVFSAFFALLLIPVGIFAYKFWRQTKKMSETAHNSDIIDAEYTVVAENSQHNPPPKP